MGPGSLLLTVVVPAYQVERYLDRCLESVTATPSDEIEIVVVDDHASDRTGEIADWYAGRDPRVRVAHLPANVGLGRARNIGFDRARGRYVWFVDGDDWLPPDSVTAVLDRLRQTSPDVLVVDHADVLPDGRAVPATPPGLLAPAPVPGPLPSRPRLLELPHSACTKVVRRAFLAETGLRFSPGWYEDSAYTHPLLLAARTIDTLDRVCYYYRQRTSGAITSSVSDRHFEVFPQYDRMWRDAARFGEAYLRFRPRLFRLMVDHLLVIAGNEHRLPPGRRREFFARTVEEYHRRLPAGGYPVPGGLAGLKHRLVRWNAYPVYAALRWVWRAGGAAGRRPAGAAPAAGGAAARLRRAVPVRTARQ